MIAGRLLWKGLGIATVSAGFSISFLAWLFSLGILLPLSLAGAAEAPVQITLEQALSEALNRNPTLSVERREIDIAKGTRRQAGIYPFNPEIEASGGAGRAHDRVDTNESRGITTQSVGISQTIWLKGQRGLRVRSAEAGVLRAQSLVQDAERQVVADTLRTYSDLLVSQERVNLAREILGVVRQVQDAAQKLFEGDAVPQLDVFRAEVEVRKAENRLVVEERTLGVAQRELALLIGRVVEEPLRALAPSPVLAQPKGDIDALRNEAFARRPDLNAALAAVKAGQAEVDLVNAERFLPELRVGLKYEAARDFDAVGQSGLLTLSIPLPLFNRRDGDLDRARAEVARQEAQVELARRRIEKEVSTAVQQVAASREIADRYVESILPQQERNFRLLREAYAIGEIRITDVFVGQREFIGDREAYLEAVGALNAATAELYRALNARP
jgi:cobalt-zinc-cadmium efflux system outer membrane protein